MKYEVYLVRYASVIVEAEDEEDALCKADCFDSTYSETDWYTDYVEKLEN